MHRSIKLNRFVQNKSSHAAVLIIAAILAALMAGCGGGGGGGSPPATSPAAPTGVVATTGNGQVDLSWSAVSGATSYKVYTSPFAGITTGTALNTITVTGTSTTVSALTNAQPLFAAVTAVNAAGESALSTEVCAVPTAASTAGLTLYDALCGGAFDGAKWQAPGEFDRWVSSPSGYLFLTTRVSNMERFTDRGQIYQTSATVNANGQRVTTLQAKIQVSTTFTSRSGGAGISAALRLAYQPPATRFNFPAANLDMLNIQVGLQDTGDGLVAFRRVFHCDNAACVPDSSSGIVFTDSAGFNGSAPASYDTAYTVRVSLNESTGVFSWSISGGSLGTVSGTADPSGYLASNPNWIALGPNPLAGAGFSGAHLRTRLLDQAGGSSASIAALIDDVLVGLNDAAPTLWDDFSGTGGNSGPAQLSADKWSTPGEYSLSMIGSGTLLQRGRITSRSTSGLNTFRSLVLKDPVAVNTLQADVTVHTCGNSLAGTNRASLEATIYNDGTPGTTAPNTNQTNSFVGDIQAYLFLDCVADTARFQVLRWNTQSPIQGTVLSNFANSVVPKGPAPVVGNTHTLRMSWDPATRLLTFQVDGATPVVVDPTTVNTRMSIAAPYVKPPNTLIRQIGSFLSVPASPSAVGATANMDFRVNNVFVAP